MNLKNNIFSSTDSSVRCSVWNKIGDSVDDSVGGSVVHTIWVSVRESVGDSVWLPTQRFINSKLGAYEFGE